MTPRDGPNRRARRSTARCRWRRSTWPLDAGVAARATSSAARPTAAPGSSSCADAAGGTRRCSRVAQGVRRARCSRRSPTSSCSPARTSAPTCSRPRSTPAIPRALAAAAPRAAPGARAVVVQGRYEHVSFILDPAPLRVVVRDVVPPHPAKLLDQAAPRRSTLAEDLPPLELVPRRRRPRPTSPAGHPAEHYLLPCRGVGRRVADGADVVLPRRAPAARGLDAARLRALPADPRVVLRRRRAAGRHLPAGRPGRRGRGGRC